MKKLSLVSLFIFCFIGSFIGSFFVSQITAIKFRQTLLYDFSNVAYSIDLDNMTRNPIYLKMISDIRNDLVSKRENFLEVNFPTMEIKLYQKGALAKEFPILAIGNPQEWGGSPLGLYKVISGNKNSFSTTSRVYMPYALRYYGKYYIHGEPYYQNGEKFTSSVTGGCIRIEDKYAKEIYESVEVGMPVLVIGRAKEHYQYTNKKLSEFPEISADAYLISDLDSGFVFAEKNSEKQLPIASLTKLMTAVVVAENIALKSSILVETEMLEPYGFTQVLKSGKRFGVVELFYPLLIESSNDAAEVLSRFLGKTKIIEMMNEKAKAILMEKTEFVDPHGLSLENVSTARDIFQLGRYIFNARPLLLDITRSEEVRDFRKISFNVEKLSNKNIFIDEPNFVGGKGGYLRKSKYTAIFIFKFLTSDEEIRNIAIILLKSEDREKDTQEIYKWLLENYSLSPSPLDPK